MGNIVCNELTICIPTLDRPKILLNLLNNLALLDLLPIEVIIVDSSIVLNDFENYNFPFKIKYVHSGIKGLTHQRNLGINNCVTKYIMMLDDDVILDKYCTRKLVDFLNNDVTLVYGAIGAVIINEFGKNFYKYQRVYKFLKIYEKLSPGVYLNCGDFLQNSFLPKYFEGVFETQFLAAGASIFRMEVVREIRPDSSFKFGGEDKHWTLRISQKFKIGVLGGANLVHEHCPTGGRKKPIIQGRISMNNLLIIYQMYFGNVSLSRFFFFQTYYLLEIIRMFTTNLISLNINQRVIGFFFGWLQNFVSYSKTKLKFKN